MTSNAQGFSYKERIRRALEGNGETESRHENAEIVIPDPILRFIDRYRSRKARLEQISKMMGQVLEKWSMKVRQSNSAPKADTPSLPHYLSEEMQNLQDATSARPGMLNETVTALHAVYKDLAALEQRHIIELHKNVVEKIYKHFLVNETPGIERSIKKLHSCRQHLIKSLEACELSPSEENKQLLRDADGDYDLALLQIHQHNNGLQERLKIFAKGAQQFASGLGRHYAQIELSVESTLRVLNAATNKSSSSNSSKGTQNKQRRNQRG